MRLRTLLTLVVVFLLAFACKRGGRQDEPKKPSAPKTYMGDQLPPPDQQGTPLEGGELVIGMEAEPPTLNFQLDPLDAWGKKINELVMESMARPNIRTWEHEPRLAESWEISEDKLTLTFHLRKGVRWHDGKRFSADDVIFTFDKLMAPTAKTVAIRSYLEPIAKYEKRDAHTVVFHLKKSYWFAFDAVAEIFIYPKHIYKKGDFNTHPANRAPIGTGRFKFVRWKTGDEIVLARNEHHFADKPHLDRLVFKFVPDPTARMQLLRRGDIDVVERIGPDIWRSMTEDTAIAKRFWRLRHVPSGLQWIGWNANRPMFRDRRARRAMTMLLDRRDIVDNLRHGLDELAVSWFYPGSKEHDPELDPWPYDPSAAADLLDDVGWQDTDEDGVRDKDGVPFEFTFLYPAGPPFFEQLASLMQTDFKKAGISVNASRLDWNVYMERLRKHEFDVCSLLWEMTPRQDPYQVWHSKEVHGGSNYISFRNTEMDDILERARHEFDEDKRVALYHRFNEILHEEEPYTMLFNRYNLSLVSKGFGGITSTPYGILSYADFFRRSPDPH